MIYSAHYICKITKFIFHKNVYSYNDINFTYLYTRTNYLRHLANIVDILWSRPVFFFGGGGGAQLLIELVNLL